MGTIYKIYLLLGSNKSFSFIDDGVLRSLTPRRIVLKAKQRIGEDFEIVAHSSILKTKPVGSFEGEYGGKISDFYNQILVIKTSLKPLKVLELCQQIEIEFGRDRDLELLKRGEDKRVERLYSSRSLDIDILKVYQIVCNQPKEITIDTPRLQVPHIQIETRPFVKTLLAELE